MTSKWFNEIFCCVSTETSQNHIPLQIMSGPIFNKICAINLHDTEHGLYLYSFKSELHTHAFTTTLF